MVFKKKEEVNYDKVETLIGEGTYFQGVITAKGTIRIDGAFKGEIESNADVVIGDKGKLEAQIKANNVLVAGELKGNISATEKIEITPTGKVEGDMRVKNLIIEEGAVFKGNCLMDAPQAVAFEKEN